MVAPNADTAPQPVPRANVRSPADAFDPQIWVTVPNVPVFAEHETTARDGRRLRFTKVELEAIARRCNQRIQETGDYAAITLGHTPEEEGAPQPEMIGLGGPFRLGLLGEPGQRQRYAILCDYHIYRDKVDLLRQYPRRSPELFLEDRYDQMYLDPIALLGAQAPRLDMGLLYCAVRGGRLVEKYAAACPSAASVFLPSDSDKTHYAAHDADAGATPSIPNKEPPPMALSPEDVRQIVDALEQLDWVQYVKQQMAGAAEPAVPEKPPAAAGLAEPAGPPAPPPPPAPPGPKSPAAAEPPKPPEKEPQKEKLGAVAQPYSADGSAAGDAPEKPGTASVAGASDDPKQGTAKGTVSGEPEGEPEKKQTVKMARVLADQQAMRGEIDQLRTQLQIEKNARRFAERYATLSVLREHLAFDLDSEADLCREFSDDQFEKYAASLRRNCQQIPLFADLPTHEDHAISDAPERPGTKAEREKFSKSHREIALRYCKDKAMRGQEANYEATLELLAQGKPLPQ